MLFFSLEPVPLNATMLMVNQMVKRKKTRYANKMQINTTMSLNRQPIVLMKKKIKKIIIFLSRYQHSIA